MVGMKSQVWPNFTTQWISSVCDLCFHCRWLFPFIGHMGIATSSGVIRDFAGPYFVSVSDLILIMYHLYVTRMAWFHNIPSRTKNDCLSYFSSWWVCYVVHYVYDVWYKMYPGLERSLGTFCLLGLFPVWCQDKETLAHTCNERQLIRECPLHAEVFHCIF